MSGEAASAKDIDTSEWEDTLQKILADYSPRDIFNADAADETGLFYKCLPSKSVTFQGQACKPEGEADDKEDVTIPPESSKMALKAIETVQAFMMQQQESDTSTKALKLALSLGNCVERVAHHTKKQSTLDAFFSRVNKKT
ncbi:tigger transposable element-derived protein 6 [Elysia marginata]|uniref:Tigger transposable element-derived protein 6 n=1 Tax=Elysia marginata TaxID=1093978 RepID=A0AAV4H052_9GAST|nr:tigger transposable element-derived protein 6 [Elysia marginata]